MPSLRYFYIISFLLVVNAFIFVGTYGRSYVEDKIILPIAAHNNSTILENFKHVIWNKYPKTFASLPCSEENKLTARCPNIPKLKETIDVFLNTLPLLTYNIYSPEGKDLLSNEDFNPHSYSYKESTLGFISAKSGEIKSDLIFDYELGSQQYNVVRSFLPIIVNKDGEEIVAAVLEVIYDITPLWDNVALLQLAGLVAIILVFAIVFITMFIATLRTEKIIAAQYEANIDLISAKASAEEENRAKSQFLANISHELRTPLNAIIGFSEIIKDEVMGPLNNKQYKEYVNDIHLSGVHLLSLINDILDFSKAEAGKLTVGTSEVDVTKIIKSSLRLVSPRANEAGVNLIEEVPKEHFILKTDGKRLKQVLLNLLSNAVKFTPSGGSVTLYAWKNINDETLTIEVQDTGVGIAEKDVSKVMATFGQVENQLSRKYEGTGLGLPLSKKLVELMGGALELKSKLGEGTIVTITLPYEIEEEAPAESATEETSSEESDSDE